MGDRYMRRWFRWFRLYSVHACQNLSFSEIEHFLIRLAALTLLLISIYRLIQLDIQQAAPIPPEAPRIEQRRNYHRPEAPPPKTVELMLCQNWNSG
jgi:hypothetical protein